MRNCQFKPYLCCKVKNKQNMKKYSSLSERKLRWFFIFNWKLRTNQREKKSIFLSKIPLLFYPTLTRKRNVTTRAREHKSKFKMADGASDVAVPRFSSEQRSMRCEQCLLNKTDGSASFSQGTVAFFVRSSFRRIPLRVLWLDYWTLMLLRNKSQHM